MDRELFLQYLRAHTLEEGQTYIREHIAELSDHIAIGEWLADEALRLLYTPFVSLKVAELLIFFGNYAHHLSSHALGLKAKGDVLLQIGHYEAALESLDAAGEEFLSLGDQRNWARSRISWVSSAGYLGRIDDALQATEQACTIFSQLGEPYWVGVINNNAALVYEFTGRYQDAIKLHEYRLAMLASITNQKEIAIQRSIGITQINLARNVSLLGNIERAYALLQQALASFTALEETALANLVEYELATLDYTQGYYGSALRHYYQARDGMIKENVDNPVFLAELKLYMANCLVKLNRAQEACIMSEEAVKACQQSGLSMNTGNALFEHAKVLIAADRLKEAIVILDEAWELFTRGGFEPYAFATRLLQAEILLQTGSYALAYAQAQKVKQYYDIQRLTIRSIQASLLMASALIANARQITIVEKNKQQTAMLQAAMSLCRQAISRARQHNLQGEIYKGHHLLGGIFALQHNLAKAAKHYAAAIEQIERMLDDLVYDLSPSFLSTTWTVYEDMIALCLQQSRSEEAFYYLEQARSMALRQHLRRHSFMRRENEQVGNVVSPAVLRTQYELRDWQEQHRKYSTLLAEIAPPLSPELSRAMRRENEQAENLAPPMVLRTQYELRDWQEQHRKYSTLLTEIDPSLSPELNRDIIVAELKRCEEKLNELFERLHLYEASTPSPHHRKSRYPEQTTNKTQRIDIAQVRQHLSADHLLLSYYIYQSKLVIFAITAEDLMVHELPDGQTELEQLLLILHANFQALGRFGASGSQKTINRLLKKLYDLLIAPVSSLLPPLSGSLTIVPYDSLHKLPFHALYNGSRYLIEDYQINYLPASSLLMHLTLRNSQQDDPTETETRPPIVFGYSDRGYLQRVQDEARTIASLLGGNCYLEEETTIARLIQRAPSSPVIHLATHGQSRLDAPNFSYVRLADGPLNAIDAFSLDLQHCELVTLSGCETGLALSGGGDEQLGLARAFLAAGAASLVISQWSVEDSSTNELMRHFYQRLLQGESKVQALRSAQCNLLHQTNSMYTHPYFWAGFRLVGDIGPLKYRTSQKS